MEPPAAEPPEEAATPTLLEKFRGRNTLTSVLKEHKSQEAKREAKRQREIERRRKLARRIAIYLRVGVCDYRGDALTRDASSRLLKAAQQIAGDRKVLGRALRAATEFMKDELLYEEELSEQGGLDESFVRSADSYERLPSKPFVPHRRTLRPVTLIRLIGKEVEHLDNPEAALDSLLYQASRLLNDFSDDGTPRPSIEETPCPSPDRQSRERLDSRCFDSERIFRKRFVCSVARRLPAVAFVEASRRVDGVRPPPPRGSRQHTYAAAATRAPRRVAGVRSTPSIEPRGYYGDGVEHPRETHARITQGGVPAQAAGQHARGGRVNAG